MHFSHDGGGAGVWEGNRLLFKNGGISENFSVSLFQTLLSKNTGGGWRSGRGFRKSPNIWQLNYILRNKQCVEKESKREDRKYAELNENGNPNAKF